MSGDQEITYNENHIRDSLARNLSVIEEGLVLVRKEKFIPSKISTRSFIDIFAHDKNGRIVLIEVKKTRAASREAAHEIFKYIEAVKAHLTLREDEIRVIVASPEWTELLIPFSSLVARTSCSITGFDLTLSASGDVTGASIVQPVAIQNGRLIAPWHELRYYRHTKDAEAGVLQYRESCNDKGIESFVILELAPPPDVLAVHSPKQATMREMILSMAGPEHIGEPPPLPKYERVLYFAMRQLSEDEYRSLLMPRLEPDSDVTEYLEEMEGDELLCSMHEALLDLHPRPAGDFLEIGYPAKLKSRLLDEDGWVVHKLHRFGAFERNRATLTDTLLIDEICGSDGISLQRFSRTIIPSDKTQLAEALKGIDRCLADNKAWRKQIRNAIDETPEILTADSLKINIFNPCTALLTFYLSVSKENGTGYIPEYNITAQVNGTDIVIYGCLIWDGSKAKLTTVLRKHYGGSIQQMTYPLLWGGYDELDPAVMKTVGFTYRTFRLDISGERREGFKLSDDGWEPTDPQHPYADVFRIYGENPDLMTEICELYASRWSDGILDMS